MDKWLKTGTLKRSASRTEIRTTDLAAMEITVDQQDDNHEVQRPTDWLFRLTNTHVVTDVLLHDVSGCIGYNGAATSTTILSLPGHSKPVADQQMEEFRAVLENDSRTTTSLIEDFPQTTASENILEEISALPSSSNKERKREKISSSKKIKTDYTLNIQRRLENESKNGTKI
ncbi:hypothetical protein AVEN_263666-1 [Araneus ventricosus]|uniref:Uncharacterized protein n=1 Tax=Araneus ventricosus TaxID=182803 RepID=A0A4Y2ASW3_ARAVE|nr:hypothetical protein AVEN_263666-1 [Araneus ventricosus]